MSENYCNHRWLHTSWYGSAAHCLRNPTQGKKNGSFVKSYKLSFSYDESSWSVYQEQNIDKVWNNSTLIFSGLFNLFVWCANHPHKMNLWQSHVSFRFINCAKKSSLMLLKMIIKYLQSYSAGRNTYQSYHGNNTQCYISQLVCALWSVNQVGRIQ